MKKTLFALVAIALFAANPRSLAEDLLNQVSPSSESPSDGAIVMPSTSDSLSPSVPASTEITVKPAPIVSQSSNSVSSQAATVQPSESTTVSASPTPTPPQASKSQNMRIVIPASVAIDPRARSVLLPRLQATGVETLLLCGYSSTAGVSFLPSYPGVEVAGVGTPFFRISGPAQSVMATLNGDLGARVYSSTRSVSNSVVSLQFIALTKPSIEEALCNDGSAKNNHTIAFRSLNIGLGMASGAMNLK